MGQVRRVEGQVEWKGERFAKLTCGHKVKIDPKEPMPYATECPECPAPEPVPA